MKICPECKDSNNLAWSWACFPDAGDPQTTDCMGCGCTWEEWELIDVQSNTKRKVQREKNRSKHSK